MSTFNDYCETIEFNNEQLPVYFKTSIKSRIYYVCEDYRVFTQTFDKYTEVKNKKILKTIDDMIIYKKG